MRKLVRAVINALGDDEVEVIMSTAALARDQHVLLPEGCILDNYRANPITLWSHDPDHPVGNAENIDVSPQQLAARVRFAPLGISRKADEVRGLTKAGVIRAVSVGFDPIEMEPLDPQKPRGGQRITKWELLELSFVSVPADPGAVVTSRSAPRAAANGARGVGVIASKRGLYEVAGLCCLFESLGCQVDMAKWEAAIEGDQSEVPAMLAAVLGELGDALLAMTQEEVAEVIAGHDVEPEEDAGDDALPAEERRRIAAARTPVLRAFRRGLARAKLRGGETLSAETVRRLRGAQDLHAEGIELQRSALRKHRAAIAAADDMMDQAGVADPGNDTAETRALTSAPGGSRVADFRRRQAAALALRAPWRRGG